MCQPVSLRNVQQDCGDFGGHRSKPRECGVVQPGSWNEAGTHWLSVGKDNGGRTGGIAGMLGPESRLPRKGDQPQRLAGDRPKNWTGTSLLLTLTGPSCTSVSGPTGCRRSLVAYAVLRGTFSGFLLVSPPWVSFLSATFCSCMGYFCIFVGESAARAEANRVRSSCSTISSRLFELAFLGPRCYGERASAHRSVVCPHFQYLCLWLFQVLVSTSTCLRRDRLSYPNFNSAHKMSLSVWSRCRQFVRSDSSGYTSVSAPRQLTLIPGRVRIPAHVEDVRR